MRARFQVSVTAYGPALDSRTIRITRTPTHTRLPPLTHTHSAEQQLHKQQLQKVVTT